MFFSRLFFGVFLTLILFSASPLHAMRKGFYKGPYLLLDVGVMHFNWDVNQNLNRQQAGSFPLLYGLTFGWNVSDWVALELFTRYSTDNKRGEREHIGAGSLGTAFFWIVNPLTGHNKWQVLPFLKTSATYQVAALPGDPSSTDRFLITQGVGPSGSGGVRFIHNKYLYFGIEFQQHLLFHEGKSQVLRGVQKQIYNRGWKKQFESFLSVGIHY